MKATAYYIDGTPVALGDVVTLPAGREARITRIEETPDCWQVTCTTKRYRTLIRVTDLCAITFVARRSVARRAAA